MSNYPNGINNLVLRGVPVEIPNPGEVFWVNSTAVLPEYGVGGQAGNEGSYRKPFDTITNALVKCVANRGDIIYVMPGYTETISAASGLAISVAGVSVIGLGEGSLRPTLSMSATGSTVAMSAANTTLDNFIFSSTIDDCVVAVISSAANTTVSRCRFQQSAVDKNFLSCIATGAVANASDGLHVVGNERYEVDAAGLAFVSILEDNDDIVISDNKVTNGATADVAKLVILGAFVTLNFQCLRNSLTCTASTTTWAAGILITGSSTTSTGVVADNWCGSLSTTSELLDTATLDFQHFNNYIIGEIAKSAKLWPIVEA